jgi:hypothetical protein
MRKRYFLITFLIIAIILVSYFLLGLTEAPSNSNESQNQENKTPTPFKFSFKFPWQASEKPNTTGSGEGGLSGSAKGGGSNISSNYTQKINYTLNINSFPEGLKIYVSYSINGEKINTTIEAPYSLEIESDTITCVLPAYITGSGVLKWTLDEVDCEFSICEDSSYSCTINMNKNHFVTLHYTPLT